MSLIYKRSSMKISIFILVLILIATILTEFRKESGVKQINNDSIPDTTIYSKTFNNLYTLNYRPKRSV